MAEILIEKSLSFDELAVAKKAAMISRSAKNKQKNPCFKAWCSSRRKITHNHDFSGHVLGKLHTYTYDVVETTGCVFVNKESRTTVRLNRIPKNFHQDIGWNIRSLTVPISMKWFPGLIKFQKPVTQKKSQDYNTQLVKNGLHRNFNRVCTRYQVRLYYQIQRTQSRSRLPTPLQPRNQRLVRR